MKAADVLVKKFEFEFNLSDVIAVICIYITIVYHNPTALFMLKAYSIILSLTMVSALLVSIIYPNKTNINIYDIEKTHFIRNVFILTLIITFLIREEYVFVLIVMFSKIIQLYLVSRLKKHLNRLKTNT